MCGMISATVLAIFFVPIFFVFVMNIFGRVKARKVEQAPETVATPGE
jgi:multidrug efflux pump